MYGLKHPFEDAYANSPHEFETIDFFEPSVIESSRVESPGSSRPAIMQPIEEKITSPSKTIVLKKIILPEKKLRTMSPQSPQSPQSPSLDNVTLLPNMRFNIPKSLFNSNEDKHITDQRAQVSFKIVQRWSLTSSIDIHDLLSGVKLCNISQDLLPIFPTFRIYQHDREISNCMMIGGHGTQYAFIYKFNDGSADFVATGDFLNSEYEIVKGGKFIIARVSKRSWSKPGHVALTVSPKEDILHVVSLITTIERQVQNMKYED
ncbi:hypothetical protein AKO1_000961 [Acrasis kona]|uniref:Uncharacterized protein n=1 Tax=Acrasis kona TaxID=1008807 RepID=A0AAW2ZCB6_9EUKA